jgi:hypothetical protein
MMSSAHRDALKRAARLFNKPDTADSNEKNYSPCWMAWLLASTDVHVDTHTEAKQERIHIVINSCQPHPHPLLYIYSLFFFFFLFSLYIYQSSPFAFLDFYSRRKLLPSFISSGHHHLV